MGYRHMSVTYNNLWKLLIDRGMNKTQMRLKAGISTATLAKMSRGEPVNLSRGNCKTSALTACPSA